MEVIRAIAATILLLSCLAGCGSEKETEAHASPTPHAESAEGEHHESHSETSNSEHHAPPKEHHNDSHPAENTEHDPEHQAQAAEHDEHPEDSKAHGGEESTQGHGGSENDEWKSLLAEVSTNINKGEVDEAAPHAVSAVRVAQEKGDPKLLMTSLHNLGKIRLSQGRTQESIQLFQEAVQAGEHVEDPDQHLAALCLNKLAAAHYANEQSTLAKKELYRALDLVGEKDPLRIELLQNLARVYAQEGNQQSAEALLEQVRLLKIQEREPPPCFGLSLSWVSRGWPENRYRSHAELYQGHLFSMNKNHPASRYLWRKFSKPKTEEEQGDTEGSGH